MIITKNQRTVTRATIRKRLNDQLKKAGVTLTRTEKKKVTDFMQWDSARIRFGGGLVATMDKDVNEGEKIYKDKVLEPYTDYLVSLYE